MISAELLKNLNTKFLVIFVRLFNRILESGDFPEEWAIGIIVLLFKGGDKTNLDNYRGITLLSIFGKLFLGILLQRLHLYTPGPHKQPPREKRFVTCMFCGF